MAPRSGRGPISETREEAGARPRVTRDAFLMNLYQQCVAVAVHVDAVDVLHVTGGFALPPQRLTRAGMEVAGSGPLCGLEGLPVHPRHHEDFASLRLLDDGGDQPAVVPAQLVGHAHDSI